MSSSLARRHLLFITIYILLFLISYIIKYYFIFIHFILYFIFLILLRLMAMPMPTYMNQLASLYYYYHRYCSHSRSRYIIHLLIINLLPFSIMFNIIYIQLLN